MRTESGISLEIFNVANPDCAALSAELKGGSHLVRIPGGQFKVRILTPHATDVVMTLDRNALVQCQVPAGLSYIEQSRDGKPFIFSPSNAPVPLSPFTKAASNSLEANPGPGEAADPEKAVSDFMAEAIASGQKLTPTHVASAFVRNQVETHGMNEAAASEETSGHLLIALRFAGKEKTPASDDDIEHILCRLNEPDRHDRLFAANFHQVVSPVEPTPHTCALCRMHQHD